VRRFGDAALVAEVATVEEAHGLAAVIGSGSTAGDVWRGMEDVVVGYRSVVVVADPTVADVDAMADALTTMPIPAPERQTTRSVDLPVAFDGPDLDEVSRLAGTDVAGTVQMLAGAELVVAFLGFLPGFAYMEGLPEALRSVPRRRTPRQAVAAGSVGIGGGFAGIYPQRSPGGWHIVGHCGLSLFDAAVPPFAVLRPGDTVRLRPTRDAGVMAASTRPPLRASRAAVVVEDPGPLCTVQDLGRRWVASLGVPRAGAADPFSLRAVNRLVGNDEAAGAIEVTAGAPALRIDRPLHLAVTGAAVRLDRRPVPADTVIPVTSGQVLAVEALPGRLRAYVAVAGGIDVPMVLGSRSSDVLSGLGPGPLRPGDALGAGPPSRPRGRIVPSADSRFGAAAGSGHLEQGRWSHVLRVVPGPDGTGAVFAQLCSHAWEVASASDRVGVRLDFDRGVHPPPAAVASRGTVTGAIQVPPDGRPVVLLCDHATVGGYPVAATVVSADLGALGRCRPGDAIRLEPVDLVAARAARAAAERVVASAVVGWYPVRSD
jgi:KipI family sensor histidine kinase inhibitor